MLQEIEQIDFVEIKFFWHSPLQVNIIISVKG